MLCVDVGKLGIVRFCWKYKIPSGPFHLHINDLVTDKIGLSFDMFE